MKFFNNLLEALKSKYDIDIMAAYTNLQTAIGTGQVMDDPKILLGLVLLGLAGFTLIACVFILLFKHPKSSFHDQDLFSLESRIQSLELALGDQRNILLTIKNQSKADFGYFKQEMKDIHLALGDLDYAQTARPERLKAVS